MPPQGLGFYAFAIDKSKVYKDGYRQALDALPMTEAEHATALASAARAFDLNTSIFEQLGERFPA